MNGLYGTIELLLFANVVFTLLIACILIAKD